MKAGMQQCRAKDATPLGRGGRRGSLPVKILKFRPSEMAFPAFWESSSEDCATLIKYLTKNII